MILFSHKLGPIHANLQATLNKAKTEHNRRNTCTNHKVIANFKPKIIKNTHAYLHLSGERYVSEVDMENHVYEIAHIDL